MCVLTAFIIHPVGIIGHITKTRARSLEYIVILHSITIFQSERTFVLNKR